MRQAASGAGSKLEHPVPMVTGTDPVENTDPGLCKIGIEYCRIRCNGEPRDVR